MYRKGKAAPSLLPLSAERRWRMWAGTCLSANLPPMTAWVKMGSVGVTPAATTSEARNVRSGIRPQMRRAETIHPHTMHGPRRKKSDRQCRFMYAFAKHQSQRFPSQMNHKLSRTLGNSTPTANTDIAMTTRVNSNVMSFATS